MNKEMENNKEFNEEELENDTDVEKALSIGATTYLVKSNYELKEIAKKIKELLN